MPSLDLSKLVRRDPDRPSLKQRAATLKSRAAQAMRRKSAEPRASTGEDAELLALEADFLAADAAAISASAALDEAEDACTEPDMPVALKVWSNDWVFSGIPRTRTTPLGDGRARLHPYGKEEVEHLRANPCMGVYIGGTEGELQPDGVSRRRPDRQAQARADAIVKAWDEWQAAITVAREAANLPALEAALKAAMLTRNGALRRIKEARAVSLAGLGVKARAVATMAGEMDLREAATLLHPGDQSGRLLYSLAADVLDLTGAPARG